MSAKPIPVAVQEMVLALRQAGETYDAIAAKTGMSATAVAIICRRGFVLAVKSKPDADGRVSLGVGRCDTCRCMVDLPCRACTLRELLGHTTH